MFLMYNLNIYDINLMYIKIMRLKLNIQKWTLPNKYPKWSSLEVRLKNQTIQP